MWIVRFIENAHFLDFYFIIDTELLAANNNLKLITIFAVLISFKKSIY